SEQREAFELDGFDSTLTKEAVVGMVPVMEAEGLEELAALAKANNCRTMLEIGTAVARTAVYMAEQGLTVTTIERDPDMIRQARRNIAESGQSVRLVEADAREADIQGTFDLIFIDAAKSQYRRFFERYAPLLSEHGIIVTDNMKFHGMVDHPERTQNRHTRGLIRRLREYRQYLESLEDWETEFLDDRGDGIAVSRRKR
ncbi:O-methyltransferase, partial [Faecalibaculum rodentium]|uniref:O-methyltransferase n=2 Tax=Faecalibaculum rodentium TaxID=1702221 RepID=UPI0034E61943